jgi:hypothetical protein
MIQITSNIKTNISKPPLEPIVALHKLTQALENMLLSTEGVVFSMKPPILIPWNVYFAALVQNSKEGRRLCKALIEAELSLKEFGVKP